MNDRTLRPLLFLDVDGTILPAAGSQRPSTNEEWETVWQNASNPQLASIDPDLGRHLLELPVDLVWATAWMNDANGVIAPILGLPILPVANLGPVPEIDDPIWSDHGDGASLGWKTRGLVDMAADRPFIWLDDEITDVDRSWVLTHHAGKALLHRVDPGIGLTTADLRAVDEWIKLT